MGMPVEKYLFDAMRRLIKSGHWLANEKGARLWRFKEGLHIVWRTGAQDIVDTLTRDKVPGIPRDEDTLADILIERGLAVPKTLPDGRHYRYWRMQPQGLEVTLYMLRLASTELIYSNEPPIVVEGIEVNDVPEATVTAESKQDSTRLESQPDAQIDKPISTPESSITPDQQPIQDCQEQSNHGQTGDPTLFSSPTVQAGSRYFCESFFGHPCPTSGKNYATANAFGGPSRPASLVAYPTRGMQHSYAMTRRDFVKPAFSLRSRSVKTHALSLLGTTRLLSRSDGITRP